MTIDVKGPDGSQFSFPDGTPEGTITSALHAHYGTGAEPAAGFDRSDPRFQDMSVDKAVEGIPILGAYAPHLAAALNTAAHPYTGVGKASFKENLAENKAASEAYEKEHPIASGVSKAVGGTLATAPLAAAAVPARLLGLTGTTGQMVGRGLVSGAAIGGADAAARGEDPVTGAVVGGVTGGGFPIVARGVASAARGVRNLVAPAPRVPHTVDLNGQAVPVSESHINPDNAIGSEEQMALSGARGPEAQRVAQEALERSRAETQGAAQNFGDEMRGGPGPSQPAATKPAAAGQTITELAQAHNDQITAQARHDAQVAAEGASLRGDVTAPLGAPEALPRTASDAMENLQGGIAQRAQASRQNVTNAYRTTGQFPGDYHPAAFGQVGQSVRGQIEARQQAAGQRPVTVNQGLTPNSHAMLDVLDNRLGQNYAPNALQRGDMIRTPDGRVIPRPLTPADVEAARQEMVGHLQDARNVQRQGGSGTDAYAAQRIMDAFDRHHNAVLQTPGAFSGDGNAYRAAIDAARAAHAQHRQTFTGQGGGDTVGPIVERIVGRHPGQEMPPAAMANALYGSRTDPGGGNSAAIAERVRNIVGENSPQWQNVRQGLISHLLEVPEGMPALTPAMQADRLSKYLATPHAREMFTPAERTRMMAHAVDLRGQAAPTAATTGVQREVTKLATEGTPTEVVKKIFSSSGQVSAGADKLLGELQSRVSQPTWNSIRQAMWSHLLEKPEGMVNWGERELSNRLSRFLESPASQVLYSERELGVMRQFQQHFDKMAPLPNTTNASGSAVMAAKLTRGMGRHILGMLGFSTGGLHGALVGHFADKAISTALDSRQLEKTKQLFLGKRPKGELNKNYERAAAVISHAATPIENQASQ